MAINDPIADMLTRIRNALMARHASVLVPASRTKMSIARILKAEGFITDYEVVKSKPERAIKVHLKYYEDARSAISGMKRVSKPGLRVYVQKGEIPLIYSGLGISVLSTSKGIKTGKEAWREGVGGELLCYVW